VVHSEVELTRAALEADGWRSHGVAYFDYVRDQIVGELKDAAVDIKVVERTYRKLIAPPWEIAGYEVKTVWEVWTR